jgi:hypothetical protein
MPRCPDLQVSFCHQKWASKRHSGHYSGDLPAWINMLRWSDPDPTIEDIRPTQQLVADGGMDQTDLLFTRESEEAMLIDLIDALNPLSDMYLDLSSPPALIAQASGDMATSTQPAPRLTKIQKVSTSIAVDFHDKLVYTKGHCVRSAETRCQSGDGRRDFGLKREGSPSVLRSNVAQERVSKWAKPAC